MGISTHRLIGLAGLVVTAAALTACATGAGSGTSPASNDRIAVRAVGTVIDTGDGPRLCGVVLESYPPQCGGAGLPLDGWSWDGLEGAESESGVTWGAYAVTGIYLDDTLEVDGEPIMLALYDPALSAPADSPLQQQLDSRYGQGVVSILPEG